MRFVAPSVSGKTLQSRPARAAFFSLRNSSSMRSEIASLYHLVRFSRLRDFRNLLTGSPLRVGDYSGGAGALPVPAQLHLLVCTIEKAAIVLRSLADQGRLGEIVAVAVDELHVVGDTSQKASTCMHALWAAAAFARSRTSALFLSSPL
eukprot:6189541-Pleurochrysis_carterae.AAC.3